uniref:Uncharacterized protein DKFZp434C0631 n=1 Tax=Homo sapiens TaxID=9606 RepID=Q8NDQ9_HUMAN|nr:hypothetical protein [Homo sapiens]
MKRGWLSVLAWRECLPPRDGGPKILGGKRSSLSVPASRGVPPTPAMGVLRARGVRGAGSQSPPRCGCLRPCDGGPKNQGGKRGWFSVLASRGVPPSTAMGVPGARGEVGLALSSRLTRGASPHCDGGPKSKRGEDGLAPVDCK